MAVVRSVWRDWWVDFERPHRFLDHHFGTCLKRCDLLRCPDLPCCFRTYFRPWRCLIDHCAPAPAKITDDGVRFTITLDVKQYAPSEILVKTVDNSIIIEAKHEEHKCPNGCVTHEFTRRYDLPDGLDINGVMSNLSTDGVLTVTAPKLVPPPVGERIVPIERLCCRALKSDPPLESPSLVSTRPRPRKLKWLR